MVSKVLFLVLVGCAFVLAKPIDENTAVDQPKDDVQVVEISEEEAKKIFEEMEEKFKDIWEKMFNPSSQESLEGVFDEIKNMFDKIFNEHKPQQPQEPVEPVEPVQSQETVEPQQSVEESAVESHKDQE